MSSRVPFLVNENLSKEFSVSKGLRQEDPFALFLFLIVVEGLSRMMRVTLRKGLYKSFYDGEKMVEMNLL